MLKLTNLGFRLAATAGVLAAVTVLTTGVRGASTSPAVPTLASVSVRTLSADNIALTQPLAAAAVRRATAVRTALSQFPGSEVREAVLAMVHNDHLVPPLGALCGLNQTGPRG